MIITGKTEPKAKVQIGFGVLNDPAEADDSGNFSLTYTLPSAKDKKINIFASLDGSTGSKDIIIKPSAEFTASIENSKNDTNTDNANNDSSVPTEYKSALRKAENYSNRMKMSKAGIYDQLTSEYGEKFPPEAAQYAIDNMKADWNANALAKAKSYQESMDMSIESIRDQLTSEYGERFTPEEAEYAIQNLGQ
ncbi:Ltp family lipoprotein [Enterococcus termitis]